MKIDYLSASRIETYLQCPKKYYYIYELERQTDSDNTRFGTLIHRVLESALIANPAPDNPKDYCKIKFKEWWPESGILTLSYFDIGYELLDKFFNYNYYYQWRENILVPPEFEFNIQLNEDVKVIGFIDLLVKKNKNTLNVIDFKTSVIPKTIKEAQTDLQMSIYYLAVNTLFPEYENIDLTLFYLRHEPVTTTRSKEYIQMLKDYLIAIYYQIRNDTTIKPNPSPLACSFCPGKNECEAFTIDLSKSTPSNIEELIELYDNINAQINYLNSRKKEISMILQQYMEQQNTNNIKTNNRSVNLIIPKQVKYNTKNILKAIGIKKFLEIVDINKKELEKIIKQNKSIINYIYDDAEITFGSPYIIINKIKDVDIND